MREQPQQPLADPDRRARQQGHRPDREQRPADERADDDDRERRRGAEHGGASVLHDEQPHPPGRGDEQVAQRAVARLARDRVARDDADRERQEQRESRRRWP